MTEVKAAEARKAPDYTLKELGELVATADADTIARLQAEENADGNARAGATNMFAARLEEIGGQAAATEEKAAEARKAPAKSTSAAPGAPTESTFTPPPERVEQATPGADGKPHQVRLAAAPAPTTLEEIPDAEVVASHQRARGVKPSAPAPTTPEEWAEHDRRAASGKKQAETARDAEAVQKGTEALRAAAGK